MSSRTSTRAASSSSGRANDGGTQLQITERDLELLLSLYKYRHLSMAQLQRLHFPSAQTATRRVRMLVEGGFVSVSRPGGGSDRLVSLGKHGAEQVASRLGVGLEEIGWDRRREQPRDPLFLQHFLAVNDFRITLTQACANSQDIRLLGFLPEHVIEPTDNGALQKYIRSVVADVANPSRELAHTPDALFALQRGDRSALFFLELDRGTEVLGDPTRGMLKAIRFYLNFLVAGDLRRYQREFDAPHAFDIFRVLIVVPTSKRLANVRASCGTAVFEPQQAKRFLWLATDEARFDERLLERAWQSLDPSDNQSYAIAGGT